MGWIIAAAVAGVLLCGGGIAGIVIAMSRDSQPEPVPTTESPIPTEPATPTASSARIGVGDCVRNPQATAGFNLEKVPCAAGTLRVVARFDGTSDKNLCQNVTNSDVVITQRNGETFVLCLQTL